MTSLLRAKDLRMIMSEAEAEEMEAERAAKQRKEKEQKSLHDAFMKREIHPDVIERINTAVSRAAKGGQNQLLLFTFSSKYCTDGGRRINNMLPDWPDSLDGFAKRAYDFWKSELRPHGYKLHVEIVSYPGGMPGDVGFILKW